MLSDDEGDRYSTVKLETTQAVAKIKVKLYFTKNQIMTIAEQIYAIVKTLPQDQASEILTFAEFIRAKHLNANQPIGTVDSPISWTELVNSLGGTWAKDFPTLEEIRAESGEDILRESF